MEQGKESYDHVNSRKAKVVANWVLGEVSRALNDNNLKIKDSKLEPAALVSLIQLIDKGEITQATAKEVFGSMFASGKLPSKIIEEGGLAQIESGAEISKILDLVLTENEGAVKDFQKGKEASFKFLIGQVMRKTRGKLDPQKVTGLLKEKLK